MVNQEIVEGLRTALSRGYSLEQAMMSFFNAGYKKEEIEEAARALYTHPSQPMSHPGKATPKEAKKPVGHGTKPMETHPKDKSKKTESVKSQKAAFEMPEQEKKQMAEKAKEDEDKKGKPVDKAKEKISKYEEKTKPKGKLITILLIILLIVLIGSLVGVFLFREQLIEFFTNLFA